MAIGDLSFSPCHGTLPKSRPVFNGILAGRSGLILSTQRRDVLFSSDGRARKKISIFNTIDRLQCYQFPDRVFLTAFFDKWTMPSWKYNVLTTMQYWRPRCGQMMSLGCFTTCSTSHKSGKRARRRHIGRCSHIRRVGQDSNQDRMG